MKNCKGCKYADWNRTKAGALHPSGDGHCTYPWSLPPLPASMFWVGHGPPRPNGGFISRKREHSAHCTYYVRAEVKP